MTLRLKGVAIDSTETTSSTVKLTRETVANGREMPPKATRTMAIKRSIMIVSETHTIDRVLSLSATIIDMVVIVITSGRHQGTRIGTRAAVTVATLLKKTDTGRIRRKTTIVITTTARSLARKGTIVIRTTVKSVKMASDLTMISIVPLSDRIVTLRIAAKEAVNKGSTAKEVRQIIVLTKEAAIETQETTIEGKIAHLKIDVPSQRTRTAKRAIVTSLIRTLETRTKTGVVNEMILAVLSLALLSTIKEITILSKKAEVILLKTLAKVGEKRTQIGPEMLVINRLQEISSFRSHLIKEGPLATILSRSREKAQMLGATMAATTRTIVITSKRTMIEVDKAVVMVKATMGGITMTIILTRVSKNDFYEYQ